MKKNIKRIIIIGAGALLCAGCVSCTNEKATKRVLEQNGFTNVTITGWRPFAKSEKDWYSTGFSATNVTTGKQVTGAVTSGFFKGNTIRFD